MRLQRPAVSLRNVDAENGRQKETVGVRDEMLSTDSENQLAGHDAKRGYPEEDI